MVRVIKRNGSMVDFDKTKIELAILNAMKNGSGMMNEYIAKTIANEIFEKLRYTNENVTIYQIENDVYFKLIEYGQESTAKAYEGYRAVQEYKRINNTTDDSIMDLVSRVNTEVMEENSNKNATIAATQRDLIAGEVSKDIARRKLLPTHIVQAHDTGAIHVHDLDYMISPIFNCFSGDTKFVTNLGVLKFNECNNGQEVEVIDKNGIWRKAVVKKYDKQKVQKITLTSGRTVKVIRATENHRWILKNGDVTTNLKVGDRLHLLEETEIGNINNDMFCFGFIIGDGTEYQHGNSHGLSIRLCGDKTEELDKFLKAGYIVSSYKPKGSNDIYLQKATNISKKEFIENKMWRYLSKEDKVSLFLGYYSADGYKDRHGISTADDNLALMIREISALAGYHITSENFQIRNTNYKTGAKLYTFRFMKNQVANKNWIVKEIDKTCSRPLDMWCVEEPITKTFTLDGGVVTGNCCLINIEDMLNNGTVINEKLVEPPKSFATACTIVTQIIAQVASNQYGGSSITVAHLAPFLRVSYEKYLNKYLRDFSYEVADKLAKDRTMEELVAGVQTIRYQLSTLQTTNGRFGCLQ